MPCLCSSYQCIDGSLYQVEVDKAGQQGHVSFRVLLLPVTDQYKAQNSSDNGFCNLRRAKDKPQFVGLLFMLTFMWWQPLNCIILSSTEIFARGWYNCVHFRRIAL